MNPFNKEQNNNNIEYNSTQPSSENNVQQNSSNENNEQQEIQHNNYENNENDICTQIENEKIDDVELFDIFKNNKSENHLYMKSNNEENSQIKNKQEENSSSNKIINLNSNKIEESKLKLNIELGEFRKSKPFKFLYNKEVFQKDGGRISTNEVSK